MSVIVTVSVKGDSGKLEQHASENRDRMQTIVSAAKSHGLIAHRFYGSEDGRILVIDEWPDGDSFHTFFSEQQANIGPLMQAGGVTSEPEVTVWRKLETHDEVGWSN